MAMERLVGRWIAESYWHTTVTIEIDIMDGRLVVRAMNDFDGELAEVQGLNYEGDEVRFAAHWPSGENSTYRLLLSDEQLVVHVTYSDTHRLTRDLNADGTHKRRSGVLHIAPGDSASGSIREAVRLSGRTDHVVSFRDDLSCGPIDTGDPSARGRWWSSVYEEPRDIDLDSFWRRVEETPDRLVVWFGRHSASEHAFFLALVDRLGDRPYDIIDVTGLQLSITRPGDKPKLSLPKQAVSIIRAEELMLLFGTERPMTSQERQDAAHLWRKLKFENALFRIVTDAGLVSAPAEIFDESLLKQATKEWRKAARIVGETMGQNMAPYHQVGDVMLMNRVRALVAQGKLIAHGDLQIMRYCELRLP